MATRISSSFLVELVKRRQQELLGTLVFVSIVMLILVFIILFLV